MLDLQPIKSRLAAATPGPWKAGQRTFGMSAVAEVNTILILTNGPCYGSPAQDADLIANAPQDLAALVAEVERLRGVIKAAQQELLCNDFLCEPMETGCPKCHRLYLELMNDA